jgi:hypothetical protein
VKLRTEERKLEPGLTTSAPYMSAALALSGPFTRVRSSTTGVNPSEFILASVRPLAPLTRCFLPPPPLCFTRFLSLAAPNAAVKAASPPNADMHSYSNDPSC